MLSVGICPTGTVAVIDRIALFLAFREIWDFSSEDEIFLRFSGFTPTTDIPLLRPYQRLRSSPPLITELMTRMITFTNTNVDPILQQTECVYRPPFSKTGNSSCSNRTDSPAVRSTAFIRHRQVNFVLIPNPSTCHCITIVRRLRDIPAKHFSTCGRAAANSFGKTIEMRDYYVIVDRVDQRWCAFGGAMCTIAVHSSGQPAKLRCREKGRGFSAGSRKNRNSNGCLCSRRAVAQQINSIFQVKSGFRSATIRNNARCKARLIGGKLHTHASDTRGFFRRLAIFALGFWQTFFMPFLTTFQPLVIS